MGYTVYSLINITYSKAILFSFEQSVPGFFHLSKLYTLAKF